MANNINVLPAPWVIIDCFFVLHKNVFVIWVHTAP
jgi:hypothetical protein